MIGKLQWDEGFNRKESIMKIESGTSFKNWLEAQPLQARDTSLTDGMLFKLFRLPDEAVDNEGTNFFYRWASRYWTMLAVERQLIRTSYERKYKYYHPVFIGNRTSVQSVCSNLLPPQFRELARSDVSLLPTGTRSYRKLLKNLTEAIFVEARLDVGYHKKHPELLKNRMRSEYVNDYSRFGSGDINAAIILTAGRNKPLPKWNLMFVSVEILGVKENGLAWLEDNRNRIWAEALHRVKSGESISVSHSSEFGDEAYWPAKEAMNKRFE